MFQILNDLNDVLRGGLTSLSPRDDLESRLGTLESLGVTVTDVQNYPQILRLTETEVIARAQRLKHLGVDPITMEALKAARFKSNKTVARKLRLSYVNNAVEKSEENLCSLLQCTPGEWQAFKLKNPSFAFVKKHPVIESKLRLLQEYGVTLDLIKQNIHIFSKSLKTLQTRLSDISSDKAKSLTQTDINYILMGKEDFQEAVRSDKWVPDHRKMLPVKKSQQNIGSGSLFKESKSKRTTKMEQIAALLDVNVHEISDIKDAHTISLKYARRKIGYLLGLGIDKRDIVNHFYFLNNSLGKMEATVKMAREAGIEKPTLILLVDVKQHKCIPRKSSHTRQLCTVASLLGVPNSEILSKPSLHILSSANRLSLKQNLIFLLDNGFSKQDILSCPLILGHDPRALAACYDSLPSRLDGEVYVQFEADREKMLNVLQYYMELENNFNCKDLISHAGRESDCVTEFVEPAECTDIFDVDD